MAKRYTETYASSAIYVASIITALIATSYLRKSITPLASDLHSVYSEPVRECKCSAWHENEIHHRLLDNAAEIVQVTVLNFNPAHFPVNIDMAFDRMMSFPLNQVEGVASSPWNAIAMLGYGGYYYY